MAELDFLPKHLRVGTSPIALTFRPVKDVVTDTILYLDSFLMCNDEELGLMAPGMYFFAAENSERIETLNFIAIDLIAEAIDRAKIDYDLDPKFSLLLSSRFLEDDKKFTELYAKLDSMELPHDRIILTFSAVTVLRVGQSANIYLRSLRNKGFKVALTDFTVDTAEISLLCDYHFDYLRIDADYMECARTYTRKNSAMSLIRTFAYKEDVTLVANGVNTPDKIDAMRDEGIYAQSGAAIARGNSNIGQIYGVELIDHSGDKYNAPIETSEGRVFTDRSAVKNTVEIGGEYEDDYVREVEYDDYQIEEVDDDTIDALDNDGEEIDNVRLAKSFMARLIQADPAVQMYYTAIKNTALSFRDTSSKVGWSYDKIVQGSRTLMKMSIRGKSTLVVYYALPVEEYRDGEIAFEDVSGDKKHTKTPVRIKVRDELVLKDAMALIIKLMARRGVPFSHLEEQDYRLPFESTESLINRGLIKEIERRVQPTSAAATASRAAKDADLIPVARMDSDTIASKGDGLGKAASRLAKEFARSVGDADDDDTEFVVCYIKQGGKK